MSDKYVNEDEFERILRDIYSTKSENAGSLNCIDIEMDSFPPYSEYHFDFLNPIPADKQVCVIFNTYRRNTKNHYIIYTNTYACFDYSNSGITICNASNLGIDTNKICCMVRATN